MSRKRSSENPEDGGSPPQRQRRAEEPSNDQDKENAENLASPRRAINHAGSQPEAGVIKKVYVENFMCHRKLTVDLCRNVNFIHGQNGSGKSAVLAAIQICLGAGARRTHRARNLKELVRKEAGDSCSGAKVRVTLLNGGPDGFQPDVYGDTITVERNISLRSGGSNGYKLLDHTGATKSTSKKDLDAMLDHLNIQVENPVAVLDQEEAKKFLTGKPEDKYAFFQKATELERIDLSYRNVVDNVAMLESTHDKVERSLDQKAQIVRQLKKEWEQYQELDKLEEKVLDSRVDYAWAFYNEVQGEAEKEEEKLNTFNAKREKREQELTQVESLTNGPDEEEQQKRYVLDRLIEEAEEATKTKRNLEGEVKHAQAPVKTKNRELNNIKREKVHAAKSLQNAKRRLEEEREKIRAAQENSDAARREAALQKAETELDELRDKMQHLKQSSTNSQRKYEELEPRVEQAKSQGDAINNQLGGIQNKIRQLESSDADSFAIFGRTCAKVDKLVQKARRERRWKGPVAGPIGAHIKIAPGKEKFASIAELALGNSSLGRFVVTNNHDRKLLQNIREQAGCPSNECGIFQVADSPRYRVPPPPSADVETVASCLNIEDDLVFNALVDHARIDQRALCVSKEASERSLLQQDGHGRLSIRGGNIKEVLFLPQGDRWSIVKNSLSMVSNTFKLKKTLGVDRSAAVAELKAEAEQLKEELKEARAKETQLSRERKDYQKQWNHDRSHLRKAQKKEEELNDTINQVQAESDEAANVTVDTTELQEDVRKAEQVVDAIKEQEAQKEREIEELSPGIQEVKNRLEEVTARNEKVLVDMQAAEQDLANYLQTISQREAQIDKKRAKLQQMQEIITQQESRVQKLADDRDKALHKARLLHYRREVAKKRREEHEAEEEMSPTATDESTIEPPEDELLSIEPVQTRKNPDYYESKIERAKQRIQKEKERRRLTESDPEVAFQKYMRADKDLQASQAQINAIAENVERLMEDLRARKKKWRRFRDHIAEMSSTTFNEILSRKGSSGEIEYDHEFKRLNLCVQKDETQASQTRDVKALSGGERSFTTLSLLLALGERLETPFRVMDEFDVFLDPVARKIALDTLVEVAKDMVHRQFIFITPQDLSALKTDPLLKIHHMKNPERNAVAGGPTQQTLDFSQSSQ